MPVEVQQRFPETNSERDAIKYTAARSDIEVVSVQAALGKLGAEARNAAKTASELKKHKYKELERTYEIGLAAINNKKLSEEIDKMLRAAEIRFTRDSSIFAKIQRLHSKETMSSRALASHDALALREAARRGWSPEKLGRRLQDGKYTVNKLAATFKMWFSEAHPELAETRGEQRRVVVTKDSVKVAAKLKESHRRRLVRYHRDRRAEVLLTINISDPSNPFTVALTAAKASHSEKEEVQEVTALARATSRSRRNFWKQRPTRQRVRQVSR